MNTIIFRADTRGKADYGWLKTNYSFSFANYQNPERMHFGLLRVLNDDWIAPGEGFRMHPHDNMEIVTIITNGELEHKDSMGHTSIMRKNDVQVMSAGTGIYHSEFNNSKTDPLELFQVWIFTDTRNHTPRYDQATFEPTQRINQWQTMVTPDKSGLYIHQQAWFSMIKLDAAQTVHYDLHTPGNGIFVFIVDGEISINADILKKRDAIGIWDTTSIGIKSLYDSEVLLFEVPMK